MDHVILESKSSFDKGAKLNMLLVFNIITITSLILLFVGYKYDKQAIFGFSGVWVLYLLVMFIGYYKTPVKYYLTKSKIYIKRPQGLIRIDLNDIKEIREFTKEDRVGMIRVFGAEGLYGGFGRYASKKHKRLDLYTSRDTNWVLIEMKFGKKYVISPDDLGIIDKSSELIKQLTSNYMQ